MQKEEYLIKNACYSVTKYYLCKRNNKRSLSGRKQRLEVVRSFPNRYQFSCINKVTSLFSNRYIFIIILECKRASSIYGMRNFRTTAVILSIFYRLLLFVEKTMSCSVLVCKIFIQKRSPRPSNDRRGLLLI